MEPAELSGMLNALWSPAAFAALVGVSVALVWLALAPTRTRRDVSTRLDEYLRRGDMIQDTELSAPFVQRTVAPGARRLMRMVGGLLPQRNVQINEQVLQQAGRPLGMTALDYHGLRLIIMLGAGLLMGYLTRRMGQDWGSAALNGLLGAAFGFIAVTYWLRMRVRSRKHAIQRALPDALDMMTIGVEAGLAFESAMLRVGDKWHNPLTDEFRRAVAEMRVGSSRDEALDNMAARCGVDDLGAFVAVVSQSSALGVSIADVLHTQADQMRLKQRLQAEELARQAGVKMVFPLVFLIFPAMFIVILGPAVPALISLFQTASGRR